MFESAPLFETVTALRSGKLDLLAMVDQACDRLDQLNPQLEAFLAESGRRERLHREALALQQRYPDPATRPPLYGAMVGVKDIFHVDGFVTRAGSEVPAGALVGEEASVVRHLRENGALILGKTVTAEFAYFEPGATRNPRNLAHTPGGSSSGSAAAVGAGFCPLALGTQTIGSVLRPAAYCGVVGFKPSYGRISRDGVIAVSDALDHVGLFTQDAAGMELAASVACDSWRTPPEISEKPRLAVPVGSYLDQASSEARATFETHVSQLEAAAFPVQRVPLLDNFLTVREHTSRLMSAQMAQVHAKWFAQYEQYYRPRTVNMIRGGQKITGEEVAFDLELQRETREQVAAVMQSNQIDLWITPAATSTAPLGLTSTGDPAMSLPWTLIGFPAITLPTPGHDADGLPYGLQVSAAFMDDERLLQWSKQIARVLNP